MEDDNGRVRMCNGTPFTFEKKRRNPAGLKPGTTRSAGHHLTY